MTTDDYARIGLVEFLAGCFEEWERNAPPAPEPAASQLERERVEIEIQFSKRIPVDVWGLETL